MVSISRRAPLASLHVLCCRCEAAPREQGLSRPRRCQALRDRVCSPAAPGRQGWKAGRFWLVHCQRAFRRGSCTADCAGAALAVCVSCCRQEMDTVGLRLQRAGGTGAPPEPQRVGLRAGGAQGCGGTLRMPCISHPVLPCPGLHLLP